LNTSGCKIDVKGGRLTFNVGKCHVEFISHFFEDQVASLNSLVSDEVHISHEIKMDDV